MHHATAAEMGFSLAELSRVPRREGKQLCFVVELQLPMGALLLSCNFQW
jgi:hypothetical protein